MRDPEGFEGVYRLRLAPAISDDASRFASLADGSEVIVGRGGVRWLGLPLATAAWSEDPQTGRWKLVASFDADASDFFNAPSSDEEDEEECGGAGEDGAVRASPTPRSFPRGFSRARRMATASARQWRCPAGERAEPVGLPAAARTRD
jgi:hypothetical protein